MNGHVTQARLEKIINLPVALAQADLRRNDSIVVASVELQLGESLLIGMINLQVLKITSGTPTRVNSSLAFVYLGIFAGGFEPLRRPSGVPIRQVGLGGPNVKVLNPYVMSKFSGPDVVEIVVVNNTTNIDVDIMVAGSMKLYTI